MLPPTLQFLQEQQVTQSKLYTCGSVFFLPEWKYEGTVVVREALSCASSIETQYYSSVFIHFPPVCYYCGSEESLSQAN